MPGHSASIAFSNGLFNYFLVELVFLCSVSEQGHNSPSVLLSSLCPSYHGSATRAIASACGKVMREARVWCLGRKDGWHRREEDSGVGNIPATGKVLRKFQPNAALQQHSRNRFCLQRVCGCCSRRHHRPSLAAFL